MTTTSTISLVLTLGVAVGCGMHDSDMMGDASELSSHMSALDQTVTQHDQAIGDAGDLATIRSIEGQHQQAGMGHTDQMMSGMSGMMQHCRREDSGARPDMSSMMGTMSLTRDEMVQHHAAMTAAADVDAARAEEARHLARMRELMAHMHTGARATEADASAFRCGMMGHG